MAYTTAQLVSAYTSANLGKAPDAATTLTLDAYATQTLPGGSLSDTQALTNTLKLLNGTTAVAVETYQFFTNRAPSAAGLAYLVNSATNTSDLNDAYYAKFGNENRFINFSINLATGSGEGATAFAASYGNTATATVSYAQVVASAYDKIIGNAAATAAGVDVAASVAFFSRQANIDYLTAFVKANTGYTAAADIDLAVKAALIGEILNAATVSGIGIYATSTNALLVDLSDGTLTTDTTNGVNILTAYPNAGGVVGKSFDLTAGIDPLVGTNNNDTFNGQAYGAGATAVNNIGGLDSIDGGTGVDTLNLSDAQAAAVIDTTLLTVKNVEVVNYSSATGLKSGTIDTTSWTGLSNLNVSLAAPGANQAVTVGAGTSTVLQTGKQATFNLAVDGGAGVTVTAGGVTTGTTTIGATTAPTGAVSVSNTGAFANAADAALGAINVKGGSTVVVTQATGFTAAQVTAALTSGANFTETQGAVTVTGTSATTSVTVNQAAAVAVSNSGTAGKMGVATGVVSITDVNAADATKAGTITSVTLANGSQTVASNALTTLNVSGTNATTVTLSASNATTSKALTINASGGTTNLTETNGVLTSVTVSAAAASTVGLTAAGVVTANLGGAKGLTFNPTSVAALKTVNITGAGGVTTNVATTGVTKIDASASTGSNNVTLNGATTKIAYVGGAGADTVILNNTLDANASIQLGAGNDRLLGGTTPVVPASTTAVIDGGDGVDAISSALISATNAAIFKNFEVLNLQSTGGDLVDVSLISGSTITGLELNGGTGSASYSALTTAQSLSVTGNSTGGTATLVFNGGAGVAGTADSYSITFNALTTGTTASPAAISAQTVSFAGIENVTVASNSAGGVNANAITLVDADARTLTVTGTQAITLGFTGFGTTGTNGVSIDASAASGGVTIATLAGLGTLDNGVGGSVIKLGAGADAITVGTLGGTQQVTLTTGGGKDVIDVSGTTGIYGAGATSASHVTITDFSATDTLKFADAGTETFTATKVDLTGVNDFVAALDKAAASATATANGVITWFQYGNNTYIVEDHNNNTTFTAGTDIVVKLTGLVDLSTAVLSGAAAGAPSLTLV